MTETDSARTSPTTLSVFHRPDQHAFRLASGEIHVWRLPLVLNASCCGQFEAWLADDEQKRAARFVFERDRHRYIACRGQVRAILAGYLGVPPETVSFRYGSHGKPALADEKPPLWFNVSHSEDLAVVALRADGELGIDVEHLRPINEAESIARRYFTQREQSALAALEPNERIAGFFRCWTRKEAILKALGVGIGFSLDAVEVSLQPQAPPRVMAIHNADADEFTTWRLYHLEPGDGYVGAIAAQGASARLVGWQSHFTSQEIHRDTSGANC